jgi:carboxymethylenebutenolidase
MNGRTIELQAADGHRPSAYCAIPDKPIGAIVLAQEVFGVSKHVRGLCDDYAQQGFLTIAPSLYDRVAPGIELAPTEEDRLKGVEIRKKISWGNILDDITAARNEARRAGKVGIVGYCLGGDIAWVGACMLGFDAAVCYYGGAIAKLLHHTNTCPVMLHNGTADPWIPAEDQAAIDTSGKPMLTIHTYEGIGHAFNNDTLAHRYHAETTRIARTRTMAFFKQYIG